MMPVYAWIAAVVIACGAGGLAWHFMTQPLTPEQIRADIEREARERVQNARLRSDRERGR